MRCGGRASSSAEPLPSGSSAAWTRLSRGQRLFLLPLPLPSARGCAFGDFDNDGDVDVVINAVNDFPELLRCDSATGNHWIKIKTLGTQSNRSGIGARLKCVSGDRMQIDEVRSGASYASQNDLRVHFGLGKATEADRIEIRWPSGQTDTLENVAGDRLICVEEGKGIVKSVSFPPK
jgi:hypothetical protein